MIITVDEVKTLQQIDESYWDTLIGKLIPLCEEAICNHCKNNFVQKRFFISDSNVSFDIANNKITLSSGITHYFIAGDTIHIDGTFRNDGKFSIDSVDGNTLTINSLYSLKSEPDETVAHIYRVDYPKVIKSVISQMINFNINEYTPGLKSEKLDDYSVAFANASSGSSYPDGVLADLYEFKNIYWDECLVGDKYGYRQLL